MNVMDLKVLNVKYVLSDKDHSASNNPYVKFVPVAQAEGYYIYELSYPGVEYDQKINTQNKR
ncbi:hypothetical protein SDC9_200621 [bioreactor metagenome]|uniref:DUF7654 domain-containing protein n=1 Tax=bioreactor metagenome TaxID=1076179 RepID=A0A645INP9_9ZZZZ